MNALIDEKAYPEAEEVIEQYSEAYGYDDECRLATARMALLQGEYDRAYPLYLYLSENTKLISKKSEELLLASEQMQDPLSDRHYGGLSYEPGKGYHGIRLFQGAIWDG